MNVVMICATLNQFMSDLLDCRGWLKLYRKPLVQMWVLVHNQWHAQYLQGRQKDTYTCTVHTLLIKEPTAIWLLIMICNKVTIMTSRIRYTNSSPSGKSQVKCMMWCWKNPTRSSCSTVYWTLVGWPGKLLLGAAFSEKTWSIVLIDHCRHALFIFSCLMSSATRSQE